MMNYIAFDIEISKPIPDDAKDWKEVRPLGISCACTYEHGSRAPLRWSGGNPYVGEEMLPSLMKSHEAHVLAEFLIGGAATDANIVTWNGLGFDFDVLVEECQDEVYAAEIAHIALHNHIDLAFQMVCVQGYMCSLQAACLGAGLKGKTDGMHGDMAPKMWVESREAQDKVLEYCARDTVATAELYEHICQTGQVKWTSRAGRPCMVELGKVMTVAECLKLPQPDTSWMSNPRPRESYLAWTKRYQIQL